MYVLDRSIDQAYLVGALQAFESGRQIRELLLFKKLYDPVKANHYAHGMTTNESDTPGGTSAIQQCGTLNICDDL